MLTLLFALACGPDPVAQVEVLAEPLGVPPASLPYASSLDEALADAWAGRPDDYVPRTKHLEADGRPRFTNRLLLETSPYLRQHAHNPVDWYPWGDEAFEVAATLGRPVFLSVGYATCHWCHVMEEESFEDLEVAAYLNANYVAIKVDREERPDVDAVYMAAVQAMVGRGGWPMSVWLTPQREVFYAGTYMPARDGDRGRQRGFLSAIRLMREAYDGQSDEVARVARELSERIEQQLSAPVVGEVDAAATLLLAAEQSASELDPVYGGRAGAPKFPSSFPIRLQIRHARRTGSDEARAAVWLTLDRMAAGGMNDQAGAGFHRYSVDETWLVPHFEKMLYDNALLAVAYLESWRMWQRAEDRRVVEDIFAWLARDMTAPSGAFYAATDADSLNPAGHREEGWFFTWTPAELEAALSADDAALAIAAYGVSAAGNFEGRSILHLPRPLTELAETRGTTEAELRGRLDDIDAQLVTARSARPPPLRDDKIIAAWNGLMISALAQAGQAFDDPALLARAERAAEAVISGLVVDGRLRRTLAGGQARHAAMLEDHAFLAAALLDLYEATGKLRWLDEALARCAEIEAHYVDPAGGYFRTPDDGEVLLSRERSRRDGAEPSGLSVHARTLLRLAALTGDDTWRRRADGTVRSVGLVLQQAPLAMDQMLLALDWTVSRPKEVVLVRPPGVDDDAVLRGALDAAGLVDHVRIRVAEADLPETASRLPIAANKVAREGQVTAYVCEGGVCAAPTTDPRVLQAQLRAP